MDKRQAMLELKRAIQIFLKSLDSDAYSEQLLEIPTVIQRYKTGVLYSVKEVFSYGVNSVGDPQLYQVLQEHTSSAEWQPDTTPSLYKPIGVTEDGYPEWVQPIGASDSYNIGDVVSYNGVLYESTIYNNVWSPEAYPAGWKQFA